MFLTIKFILDCNTLTRLERTSSSWVHCSNGQDGPESFGAPTIQNGYLWAFSAWGSRRYRSFGVRWGTKVPKIPGSVTRRIFPPNSSAEHQGYHEVFRPGAEKGEGAVATHYPPQSASTPTTSCQGSMDPNKDF